MSLWFRAVENWCPSVTSDVSLFWLHIMLLKKSSLNWRLDVKNKQKRYWFVFFYRGRRVRNESCSCQDSDCLHYKMTNLTKMWFLLPKPSDVSISLSWAEIGKSIGLLGKKIRNWMEMPFHRHFLSLKVTVHCYVKK